MNSPEQYRKVFSKVYARISEIYRGTSRAGHYDCRNDDNFLGNIWIECISNGSDLLSQRYEGLIYNGEFPIGAFGTKRWHPDLAIGKYEVFMMILPDISIFMFREKRTCLWYLNDIIVGKSTVDRLFGVWGRHIRWHGETYLGKRFDILVPLPSLIKPKREYLTGFNSFAVWVDKI